MGCRHKIFILGCTQCIDCIDACQEKIIIKGDGGFPEVDFSVGKCTLCHKCVMACDEPLFKPLDTLPWQLMIEIQADYLVKKVYCQVCQDTFEPEAISFKYLHGSVPQPEMTPTGCNRCGACIAVCP